MRTSTSPQVIHHSHDEHLSQPFWQEAGITSVAILKVFLLHAFSVPYNPHLQESLKPGWKWWNPAQDIALFVGSSLLNIVQYFRTSPLNQVHFSFTSQDFPFQDALLSNMIIVQFWITQLASLSPITLFAKNASKTSIAALDCSLDTFIVALIPHTDSIFTDEVPAIQTALTSLPAQHEDIYVLPDSCFILIALKDQSFKCPTVILLLLKNIQCLNSKGRHSCQYETITHTLALISPEDSYSLAKEDWKGKVYYAKIKTDNIVLYAHLLSDRLFSL